MRESIAGGYCAEFNSGRLPLMCRKSRQILSIKLDTFGAMNLMNLREIGMQVRDRREALGLSQERLAKLAGISRATINQLETGSLNELGVMKLAALLELIGLQLQTAARSTVGRKASHPLLTASRTASVSYRTSIAPHQLAKALASGDVPTELVPHVATFLDEAPLPLVVSAVEEAAARGNVPPKRIWRNVTKWAHQLRSPRRAWV